MSETKTLIRSLHDLGGAAWFGGSLMGAIGLNGAVADILDPADRLKVASSGWARWAPFSAAAIGAHVVGSLGLIADNADRLRNQDGVARSAGLKTVVTAAAIGTTAYSGFLGAKQGQEGRVPIESGTTPSEATPDDVAKRQQQLKALQWATPVLVGAALVLAAQQGETQKAGQVAKGVLSQATDRVTGS